jgi:hypothetical protein
MADRDYPKCNDFLIKDENEAVEGYNDAILGIANSDLKYKKEIMKQYREIHDDEIDHINKLKSIRKLIDAGSIDPDEKKAMEMLEAED